MSMALYQGPSSTAEAIHRVFFEFTGECYSSGFRVDALEISRGHDVHAFYFLADKQSNQRVLHIQGYPGFSTNEHMTVTARFMNQEKLFKLRREGASIGNEHEATERWLVDTPTKVPYGARELTDLLMHNF
jgi:hypothetical protein